MLFGILSFSHVRVGLLCDCGVVVVGCCQTGNDRLAGCCLSLFSCATFAAATFCFCEKFGSMSSLVRGGARTLTSVFAFSNSVSLGAFSRLISLDSKLFSPADTNERNF